MLMIDSHCHLTYPGLFEKVDDVLRKCKGILRAIITTGFPYEEGRRGDLACFEGAVRALKLAEKHPDFLFVTLGLHPTHVPGMGEEEIERYVEFIRINRDKIVGIGEVGLDKHWIKEGDDFKRTLEAFHVMLDLAEEIGKPVVIHSRKAEEEVVEILQSYSFSGKALLHSYTGNMTTAKRALDCGFLFSVNYKLKSNKSMRKIARSFPLDSILTETDSPFLSESGEVNTPLQVKLIIEEISRLREVDFQEVDEVTTLNAARFFNLPL